MGKSVAAFVVAVGLLCGAAQGQGKLTVNPSVLVGGEEATVSYSNPELAGQTVQVEISPGCDDVPASEVLVDLDENGDGSSRWPVPTSWSVAHFTAPGAPSVSRMIAESEEVVPPL